MKHPLFLILLSATTVFFFIGRPSRPGLRSNNRSTDLTAGDARGRTPVLEPCALIQIPHPGETPLDQNIQLCQRDLPTARQPELLLEKLGWLYVEKARAAFDPGFYTLAEQCAACLEAKQPRRPAAMLLLGHAWQSLHRFREAEPVARTLVAQRGSPFDFGLLGDVLMEQGKLTEAIDAYQTMVNLRPDPHAYARIAHVRWLRGDLEGAVELSRMAANAVGVGKSEAAAWIHTRRALYEWSAGRADLAREGCQWVFQLFPDYAPARLLLGRILLAEGANEASVLSLRQAALLNPLPEYLWALAEALEAAGKSPEAREVEAKLARSGAVADPRTYALYLATRRQEPATALGLAKSELKARADVHTHDALAWALAGNGLWTEAYAESLRALAEGTPDPRLYLHAGFIAQRLGKLDEAQARLSRARSMHHLLLPSEQRLLDEGTVVIRTAGVATH
jgi:tetratricopeptide (TPR) repeat protein